MDILRNAIKREIKRRGITPYAFARDLDGLHQITVLKWLYSNRSVSARTIEHILEALSLVVVPKSFVNGADGKSKQ